MGARANELDEPLDEEPGTRVTMSVTLNPSSRNVLESLRQKTDQKNVTIVALILEWFAGLDPKLQMSVLTRDVGTQREMLTLLLRQMLAEQASVADFGPLRSLELPELLDLARTATALAADKAKHYELKGTGKGKKS